MILDGEQIPVGVSWWVVDWYIGGLAIEREGQSCFLR